MANGTMKFVAVILALFSVAWALPGPFVEDFVKTGSGGKHWALIIAGSNGWYNYRHQADVCHAFQVIKKHGIPEERIVVMMYDDIAHNRENPFPGMIINQPNGSDVYGGVPKDYTGEDVTPDNFLKILRGKDMSGIGSGKVIKSGPEDHVFVYFADHGAPHLIAFPSDELHASKLNMVIEEMFENKQFEKMVLYIEACESGSMFDGLLKSNWNVFATTASNPRESSYACYYDKKRRTYLGDVYSVMWLQDSDIENLKTETLAQQFSIVKKKTNTSHVMEYGDMSIAQMPVAEFQAGVNYNGEKTERKNNIAPPTDAVPQEDVQLSVLHHRLEDTTSPVERREIIKEMRQVYELRHRVTYTVERIVRMATRSEDHAKHIMNARLTLSDHTCYVENVKLFSDLCFKLGQVDWALRYMYTLVNMCADGIPRQVIHDAIYRTCTLR